MEKIQNISNEDLNELLKEDTALETNPTLVANTATALELYAQQFKQSTTDQLKQKIKNRMSKLNHQQKNRSYFTIDNLPMLSADSNVLDWEAAVASISPPTAYDGIYMHVLVSDEKRDLLLGWSKEIIPEEVHDDLIESFIVLEGTCACKIWKEGTAEMRTVHMVAGDFLQLEIGESHDVITTSSTPVKAILQRLKI